MSDDLTKLADLVRQMRDAQRQYFRTKLSSFLVTSKQLEVKVDRLVAEVLDAGSRPLLDDLKGR